MLYVSVFVLGVCRWTVFAGVSIYYRLTDSNPESPRLHPRGELVATIAAAMKEGVANSLGQ